MIFDDLLRALEQGRSPILLTERTAHLVYFENRLKGFAKNVIVMRGGMGKKQREALRTQIASTPDTEERVFIATGKLMAKASTMRGWIPYSWFTPSHGERRSNNMRVDFIGFTKTNKMYRSTII